MAKKRSWTVASLSDVAEFFGVALPTVKDWRRLKMPGHKGRWDLAVIAKWRLARERNYQQPADAEDVARAMAAAKLRKELARAEIAEYELDALKGRFVEKTHFDQQRAAWIGLFVAELTRLPTELGPKLSSRRFTVTEVRAIIKAHINTRRRELAQRMER